MGRGSAAGQSCRSPSRAASRDNTDLGKGHSGGVLQARLGKGLCNGGERRAGQGAACREMARYKPGYCFARPTPIVYPLWVPGIGRSVAQPRGQDACLYRGRRVPGQRAAGQQSSLLPCKPPAVRAARVVLGCETKCMSSGLIGKTFKLPIVFWGYLRSWRTGLSRCLSFLSFSLMAYSSFPLPDSFVVGQKKNAGFVISVFF